MNKETSEKLLNEAIRIGEEIYKRRKEDVNGIYWETLSIDKFDYSQKWKADVAVYDGISGIVLFYIALYKVTRNKKYLDVSKRAMDWVYKYCLDNNIGYSFIAGLSGVSYTLLKLFNVCKGDYLEKALHLIKDCDKYLKSDFILSEYNSGSSGILLALLHLYNETGEKWILDKINIFIENILVNSSYNFDGIHWDRSFHRVKSLCGFAHGTSGIGFVFLETGNLFKNPIYFCIAEQAFKYESNFYSKRNQNWMDLRINLFMEEIKPFYDQAYERKNYKYFYIKKFMSAWCHGAPGISLVRLRAHEFLNSNIYKKEYKDTLENILRDTEINLRKDTSFNLCHGILGNLDLVIESQNYKFSKNIETRLEKIAKSITNNPQFNNFYFSGLPDKSKYSQDYSLFLGNAGIGHFYLRLIEPKLVESVLIPKIQPRTRRKISPVKTENKNIKHHILNKMFPRTLKVLQITHRKEIDIYLNEQLKNNHENILKNFIETFDKIIKGSSSKPLKEVYKFEHLILNMERRLKCHALAYCRFNHNRRFNKILFSNDEALLISKPRINPHTMLYKTEWDMKYIEENIITKKEEVKKETSRFLLVADHKGVNVHKTSLFSYYIINYFKKRETVSSVLKKIKDTFGNSENNNIINNKAIEQIRILLKEGILICDK